MDMNGYKHEAEALAARDADAGGRACPFTLARRAGITSTLLLWLENRSNSGGLET
jgi:hypothetical protein